MPVKNLIVKSYLNQDEYEHILEQANQAGLSISSFIKRVCLGEKISSSVDNEALIALLQSKADLGRLGGLLKQYLSSDSERQVTEQEVRTLFKKIEEQKKILSAEFFKVSQSLHHKKNPTDSANFPGQILSTAKTASPKLAARPER